MNTRIVQIAEHGHDTNQGARLTVELKTLQLLQAARPITEVAMQCVSPYDSARSAFRKSSHQYCRCIRLPCGSLSISRNRASNSVLANISATGRASDLSRSCITDIFTAIGHDIFPPPFPPPPCNRRQFDPHPVTKALSSAGFRHGRKCFEGFMKPQRRVVCQRISASGTHHIAGGENPIRGGSRRNKRVCLEPPGAVGFQITVFAFSVAFISAPEQLVLVTTAFLAVIHRLVGIIEQGGLIVAVARGKADPVLAVRAARYGRLW